MHLWDLDCADQSTAQVMHCFFLSCSWVDATWIHTIALEVRRAEHFHQHDALMQYPDIAGTYATQELENTSDLVAAITTFLQ